MSARAPGLPFLAAAVTLAVACGPVAAATRAPAPELRSAFVARASTGAWVVVRLTGDLPRDGDGAVRASMRIGGRPTGPVRALDRLAFRHYCFRATLRAPLPDVGERVGIAVRAAVLDGPLRTTRTVRRARPGDAIGARLGCRLPGDGA